jgi:hypothetical protein
VIRRLLNVFIALDQLAWVLATFGHGSPDETVSSAAWRMESQGKLAGMILRPVIDAILFFDPGHCRKAWEAERDRIQLPKGYQ